MNEIKEVFAYLRKSTDRKDKQALSLPAQKKWCIEHAKFNNLKIIKFFEESES
jgi:DNA invertase Pin-like site-specific DNA recombinase